MYNINTGQSRTDLYKVNEGSDQVFDPSLLARGIELNQAAKERKIAEKQKVDEAKDADIYSQLSQMGGKAIMPHDTQIIADKGQALRDYTIKNIDALRNNSPVAKMEYDRLLGDYQTTTSQSVDKRQKWEQTNQLIAANPNKYRDDSRQNQLEFASSAHAGEFGYNPDLKENFDTQAYVKNTIRPLAEDLAVKGEHDFINPTTGIKTTYTKDNLTLEETDKLFHDTMLANPKVYEQERYKLANNPEAQKKYGNDVNAYIKDQYYNQFQVNRDKTLSSDTYASGAGNKAEQENNIHVEVEKVKGSEVSGDKNTENTATTMRKANGQPLTFINPDGTTTALGTVFTDDKGKTIANGTRTLNKAEIAQNKLAIDENNKRERTLAQAKVLLDKGTIDQSDFDSVSSDNQPKELPFPNTEIPVKLGKEDVDKIVEFNQNKQGAKKKTLSDIHSGDLPKGYTLNDKRGSVENKSAAPKEDLRKKYNY